jgi:prepilin-type processing-associated H-X9-DG protein
MGTTDGSFPQCGEGMPVKLTDITDGLSNTLLVGEKHVPLGYFGQGPLDSSFYNGDYFLSHSRPAGPDYPLAQTLTEISPVFGSYHTFVVQFAFCDGHVEQIKRTISPVTLGLLASINDGLPIPDY